MTMRTTDPGTNPQLILRPAIKQTLHQRFVIGGMLLFILSMAMAAYFMFQQHTAKAAQKKGFMQRTTATAQAEIVEVNAEVSVKDNVPVLTWKGNFAPNSMFLVERSTEGNKYEVIQRVPKEEVMTEPNKFEFSDPEADGGETQYKISYLGPNDEVISSDIVTVSLTKGMRQLISITGVEPTTFDDQFTVTAEANKEEVVSFEIMNYTGKVIYSEVYDIHAGVNLIGFTRGATLAQGVYMIRLSGSDNAVALTRMVKR